MFMLVIIHRAYVFRSIILLAITIFFLCHQFGNRQFGMLPSQHIILKADVTPSMRVNDTPHHPWIALTNEGTVAVAHCDCMAG